MLNYKSISLPLFFRNPIQFLPVVGILGTIFILIFTKMFFINVFYFIYSVVCIYIMGLLILYLLNPFLLEIFNKEELKEIRRKILSELIDKYLIKNTICIDDIHYQKDDLVFKQSLKPIGNYIERKSKCS